MQIPTTELMEPITVPRTRGGALPWANGRLVSASGHLFQVVNGRRVWVSEPPAEWLNDTWAELDRMAKRQARQATATDPTAAR